MPTKLNRIIKQIIVEKKIDILQETKEEIKKFLGKSFFKKNIQEFFLKNNQIIIQTKTIEAKTEINLIKKNFNTVIKFL